MTQALHPNAQLIHSFYGALQRRDGVVMGACYGPHATFQDPVFGQLDRERAAAMWRMLCERATDLDLTVSDVAADDARGTARWEARYTFTATGRHVTNRIQASFEFSAGRIQRHVDQFDLYAWARQALGPMGLLLGWAPPIRYLIRARAARGLAAYMAKHGLSRAAP
jgi:ketosteroid isomerase-like protein